MSPFMISQLWFELWESLAGALASELVMARALDAKDQDLRRLAYAARGLGRTYGWSDDAFAWHVRRDAAMRCRALVMQWALEGEDNVVLLRAVLRAVMYPDANRAAYG